VRIADHLLAVDGKTEYLINSRRDIANFTIYFCAVFINSPDISRALTRDRKFKSKWLLTMVHRKNPATRAYIYSNWTDPDIINDNSATASSART
jgi:hypothetical protein